jgi:uncharacterized protein
VADPIPMVDYLVLSDEPRLVALECERCGARFFDRRNACASCGAAEFRRVPVPAEGTLRTFTIVSTAAPGVPVPFVAAIVDCGGTTARGILVNVEPDPKRIPVGMKVRLTTVSLGTDETGVEAVGYGFEPA